MFRKWRMIILTIAALAMAARPSLSMPGYFTAQGCSACHTNDSETCIGCHHHGGNSGSPAAATTNKTSYAPGETITVTLTGASTGGWARALLYNQSNVEVARVAGPTGQGDDGTKDPKLHFPFTLTALAPTAPGTYTWKAGWWGSPFDVTNRVTYPHGPAVLVNTNSFTVAAPVVTGTVSINAGAAVTKSTAVTLTLSVTGSGVTQMRFSNDNATWSAWQAYATSKAWTLAAGDGAKTVYVQFGSATGAVLANANDAITLDTTAPTGTVSVAAGAAYTRTTAVTLTLSATGATQMRFSNDNVTWSAWETYAASKAWTLTTGDGLKTVYVQFQDAATNISATASDTITLDTTVPTGTVSIAAGAAYTRTTAVTLTLSATGVTQMRFSNDNTTWSAWEAYAASKAWTLAAGGGLKTVYVQFQDAAGNISTTASDTITLDTTAPTGTVSVNSGAALTNTVAVTLTLSATGATQMRFSNDNATWSAWEAYAASKAWTLTTGDGLKTVYVQFQDAAANVSASASDTITLDTTVPTGTVSIAAGAAYTRTTAVTLTLSATGATQMRFSNDNTTWSAWEAYAASKAWVLAAGDGLKTVYVQYQDAGGSISASVSDTITLDTTAPTGTVSINSGATQTNTAAVTLTLSATGATQMRFSNDNATWSAWEAYAASKAWTLTTGDGLKTVYVQFQDAAANVSASASDTITLDTTVPTGTVSINSGAAQTNSAAVTLTLSATGATQMRFSNDNATWSVWETYAATKAWALAAGDGLKTVYVQYQDAGGSISASVSDTITLDTTAPTGTVSINSGATQTNTAAVTLTLSATGATQMRFSNDNATWSAWEAYAASKAWTLTTGNGLKTVYVQFQDARGNVSASFNDTITLAIPVLTGTATINAGAAATNLAAVNLALSLTGGTAAQMRFSNDNATWSAWEPYAATKAWTLTGGTDGLRTVYVQFGNAGGSVLASASDTITLDTTAPTGSLSINSGAAFTNSAVVRLALTATDAGSGVSQMRFSPDNATWSAWDLYLTSTSVTLPGGNGSKSLYVQYRDAAGNISATYQAAILLDTVAPAGSVIINSGAAVTHSTSVTLGLSASDSGSSVVLVRLSDDKTSWTAWQPYQTSGAWALLPGDGLKAVYAQYRDGAGNSSAISSDTIVLDSAGPSGTLRINGGAGVTTSPAVTLQIAATDLGSAVAQMRFSNDNVVWSAWQAYASVAPWTLTAGDGRKTVYAQFQDASGNVSAAISAQIMLSMTPAAGTLAINAGAAFTNSAAISLSVTLTGGVGVTLMQFSNDQATWSAWEPIAATKAWTLSSGDGVKTVYVQFADASQIVRAAANDSITLDTAAPAGTVLINGGAATTTSPAVSLALSATDTGSGVTQMRFSNDNATWSAWENYGPTKAWTVASGSGSRTVYVQFRDAAGNISATASDSITVGSVATVTETVIINWGAAYTRSRTVSVAAYIKGGTVSKMRYSNDNVRWSAWAPYVVRANWQLSSGDGTKTVYVQCGDASGAVLASAKDTIVLDTLPPAGSLRINSGAASTNSRRVVLTLTMKDALTGTIQMRLRNDKSPWGNWEYIVTRRPWILRDEEGIRTVLVQFRDRAGNTSTEFGDQIRLVEDDDDHDDDESEHPEEVERVRRAERD